MYSNKKSFLRRRYDPINRRTINYKDDPRIDMILSHLKEAKGPVKLLDIGCYDGYIGMRLKQKIGSKCNVYGIDVASNSIKLAQKNGTKAKVNDVTKGIKYKTDTFDYVFAGEVIEHLYDTDFFMREIKRVLKPNGTLILTTPNTLSLGRRLNYLIGNGVFLEVSFSIPKNAAGHIRYFTFATLRTFVSMHNFEVIKIFSDTVTFPGFRSNLLAKAFPTFGHHIIAFLRNKK